MIQMVYSFFCTLTFFIHNDWTLIENIVDFWLLESKDHKDENAVKVFTKGGREQGSLNKMSI